MKNQKEDWPAWRKIRNKANKKMLLKEIHAHADENRVDRVWPVVRDFLFPLQIRSFEK